MNRFRTLFSLILFLSACSSGYSLMGNAPTPTSAVSSPTIQPTADSIPTLPTSTVVSPALWVHAGTPLQLQAFVKDIPRAASPESATARLDIVTENAQTIWIYALVAPFPTLTDDVTEKDLRAFWTDSSRGPFGGTPLWMAESTLRAFTALWGEPASGSVKIVPENESDDSTWGIVPFESIQPKWKTLTIDGQSPIRKNFNAETYPLKVGFRLSALALELPASNYDASKLTTVLITGVTALTRATAVRMEERGVLYPAENIRNLLLEADITHISNEVPFYGACPEPTYNMDKEVFCSSARYMELFKDIDVDVIELTGNHFADYGNEAMQESFALFKEYGIPYFGGGVNLEDSLKPLLMESNGNRIAFIGCNEPDVGKFPTATASRPGAAPCNFDDMSAKVKELASQGYLVMVSFQWSETPNFYPFPAQEDAFRRMVDSGAAVVSGTQAHIPQYMEWRGDAFIHYGLGNLFFDQVQKTGPHNTQKEFIDRHIFYNGRYLGVELITTYLEDYGRPRLMTPAERVEFLTVYFEGSGWTIAPETH